MNCTPGTTGWRAAAACTATASITWTASATSCRDRVHIQCELEEAGLDLVLLNRMADSGQLRDELQTWTRAYIDVNQLAAENQQLRREAEELRRTGK